MNTQHTPGPWTVEPLDRESGDLAIVAGQSWIATTLNPKQGNERANAALLAAAPELLHALQLLYDTGADGTTYDYARSKARAAIARATGADA